MKGVPFVNRRMVYMHKRGTFFVKNGMSKGKGLDLEAKPLRLNIC